MVDFRKQTKLQIGNGRVSNDTCIGTHTFFIRHNGFGLVDYVLASENMFEFITSFVVYDSNPFFIVVLF